MKLRFYNTRTRAPEPFVPANPDRVTMYVCGPTVYSYPHIGNARPAVVFDVLFRLLKHTYKTVVYARNITDVDDKINAAAEAEGIGIRELTDRYTAAYHEDMRALGVLDPSLEPRATDNIGAMITVIEKLIAGGYAYAAEGHVLFNVPEFKEYGALSRRDRDEMIAGARVEVAPYKKDPSDFVLWKPSTGKQPGWDSPWGKGRPGWHLECSTMIQEHLGQPLDIHGGGHDLVFPHHENEIALGTCAHNGALFCRTWLHNGFLSVDEEKMSKSLGNVLLVRDLLKKAPGEAIRLALLSAHYRKPINWNDDTVAQAVQSLDRLYRALEAAHPIPVSAGEERVSEPFLEALADDLNTPRAMAELHNLAHALNKAGHVADKKRLKAQLLGSARLMGLLEADAADWLHARGVDGGLDADAITALLHKRKQARIDKDFETADRIREELQSKGVIIEDQDGGTRWRWAHAPA